MSENKDITITSSQLGLVGKVMTGVYRVGMLTMGVICTVCLCQLNSAMKQTNEMVDAIGYQQYAILNGVSVGTSTGTSSNTSTSDSSSTANVSQSSGETEDVQQYAEALFATDYFKQHVITAKSFEDLKGIETGNNYNVYFYQSTCSACSYTDYYLLQYINQKVYENPEYGNIYFLNIESQDYEWAWSGEDKISSTVQNVDLSRVGIEGTPTMLKFKTDGTVVGTVGVTDVLESVGIVFSEE